MAFGDVLAGYGEAAFQNQQNLLQLEYGKRKAIADYMSKLGDDPRYDEASRAAFHQEGINAISQDLTKPYKAPDFSKMQVQPPTPPGGGGPPQTVSAPTQSPLPPTGLTQIAPPGPPPTHAVGQMLPFEEQLARTGQQAVAQSMGQLGIAGMRASIPQRVGVQDVQGDDGLPHQQILFKRRDIQTGQEEIIPITSPQPKAFLAPKEGAVNTVANLKKYQEENPEYVFKDENGKPLDLSKFSDTDILQHIGQDRFVPKSPNLQLKNVGNQLVPYNPITGTPGGPSVGPAPGALPVTTSTAAQHQIELPGGKKGLVTQSTTSTRTKAAPGPSFVPGAPIPPLGQQAPQVAPQGVQAPASLPQAGVSQPTQNPVPAPKAPPGAQRGAPTVTEIPGAGSRLKAKDLATYGQQVAAYKNMAERTESLIEGMEDPAMRSVLERAKLDIVAEPDKGWKLVAANLANLNPQEQKFVSDYISASDEVNVLRKVYGVGPARGAKALEVLLAQRGNLLGNPAIFTGVLTNTLNSVMTQMTPMVNQLRDSGVTPKGSQILLRAQKRIEANAAR